MRNLTIKRNKSFVGCLVSMKVYIEDQFLGDEVIQGVLCKKVGELKNGEEKTFQIQNNSQKVFVIAGKMSKNICFDYFQIDEGTEDVYLSGQNRYNMANGNAFIFENNNNEEALKARKKGKKKGLIILIIAFIVGFVGGFLKGYLSTPDDKTFNGDGFTITLTDEFVPFEYDGCGGAYESDEVIAFAQKYDFTNENQFANYTTKEFLEYVNETNENADSKTRDNLTYFEFEADVDGIAYHYYDFAFKANDSFWLLTFACPETIHEEQFDNIIEWAKTFEPTK